MSDYKKAVNGNMTVTRQYTYLGKDEHEEVENKELDIHRFHTEPASVYVKFGRTVNVGNFESVRLDVGVNLPCYKEEIEGAYQRATKFVVGKIQEEMDEIESELSSEGSRLMEGK